MLISIAIPCYNSTRTLPPVVEGIRSAFAAHPGYDYQLILVNDGSPDGTTFSVISQLCDEDPRIIGVDLARNFGQASAKMSALPYVTGDILVYMDDDGQHPAEGIFALVEAVEQGADLAIAAFQHKKHSAFKRLTSWLNAEMLCLTIQKPRDIQTSSFAAYSSFLIERLRLYRSPFVSMFAYVLQNTRKLVNVPMPHQERLEGSSGYTLKKLLKLWSDGLFSFSTVPLQLIGMMSTLCAGLGILSLLVSIVLAVLGKAAGVTVLLGALLLVGALILFSQSLLGAYLGRIYLTQNQQPQYVVRTVRNAASEEGSS
jgi:undecaprenyl-phosphate 4-deoxy-4-formamido-L-arabinose transferase